MIISYFQLLDVGNDNLVNKCGSEGYTPLHFAVSDEKRDEVILLVFP